jgi:hypothetical protein
MMTLNSSMLSLRNSALILLGSDPVRALTALERAKTIAFLVTRLQSTDRQPVGLSLARLARTARPDVRVVFTGMRGHEEYARGLGEFIPEQVEAAHVGIVIEWLTEGRDNPVLSQTFSMNE